uniref:type IX secretion system plug protein n=1 Tax=Persicitalea sp. TaxID=3100273 RepID=UPI0035943C1C
MRPYYYPLFLLVISILPNAFAQVRTEDVRLEDYIYNENIKTVLLYPAADRPDDPRRLIGPAVIPLGGERPLMLEFDDMTADYRGFRAKLIHCNADWNKSVLNDIEFTYEYNDYPITEFKQSFSTKVPYYHYRFQVPRLKVSGNYVLVVYSERQRQVVFTRRFMIYENKVRIAAQARFSQGIREQRTDQQIDFSLDHKGYQVVSPQTDLKVVIRQNFRWDKAKTGFKPTNVRPFDSVLEYQFFNLENTFPGG